MTALTAAPARRNQLTAGKIPTPVFPLALVASLVVVGVLFAVFSDFGFGRTAVVGVLLFAAVMVVAARAVEGARQARDRFATILVSAAFALAVVPLVSLVYTAISRGADRFDPTFFTYSMRSIVGAGGGAVHAITGTVWVTLIAAVISIPIGLMTSVYLVEYGTGGLARSITFFVDVMTGIPSIVAGLFAYSLFVLFLGPGTKTGLAGAVALCVLMIPIVVRASEEMLRLVPNELREASYALGVPKWRTVLKIVLPTALGGIITGSMLAVARVIGETAPLLIAAGYTQSLNNSPVSGPMMTLPVFVYRQYADQGQDASAYIDRAWTGALTLILIVMILNLAARLIAAKFAPKSGR